MFPQKVGKKARNSLGSKEIRVRPRANIWFFHGLFSSENGTTKKSDPYYETGFLTY